jgi:hypothetical protein
MSKRFETGKLGSAVIGGVDSDNNPKYAIVDRTGALGAMEYEHYTVHQSYHYFFTDKFELASAATRSYLITTPTHVAGAALAPAMHLHFKAEGSAITQFDFYEDTSKSATTDAALTSYNSNRNSTDTAEMKIELAASTTDSDGTLIFTFKGGAASQQSRTGDTGVSAQEIILKKNAKYLARFTSGTDSNLCDLYLLWYEQQP